MISIDAHEVIALYVVSCYMAESVAGTVVAYQIQLCKRLRAAYASARCYHVLMFCTASAACGLGPAKTLKRSECIVCKRVHSHCSAQDAQVLTAIVLVAQPIQEPQFSCRFVRN